MKLNHRQRLFLITIALIVAMFVAYEPIRHNSFVALYDDSKYITKNPNVSGGITQESVIWALTKPYESNWHPLTWLSHMLDCQLFGLKPAGHHLVSVTLHIINALLLFWILVNLTGSIWASAFVAAVFALHPLQVESVAWAAERKTVLSGLFWMLTIAVYIRYAKLPGTGRYVLLLLVYGLCIMTKPVVVTLPLVLLLLDYWPLNRLNWGYHPAVKPVPTRWLLVEKIPLLVLSVILSITTLIAQQSGGAVIALETVPLDCRIANMFVSYIKYIGKMIWPSQLAVIYPYPRVNFSNDTVVVCTLLFALITALAIYIGRRRKYAAMGWLWYVGTLVPMIGLVQVGNQAIANRYMYLSMLGLLIIVAWAIKEIASKRPRWRVVATVLAVVALSSAIMLTRIQVRHWQNSKTLFKHTLKVTENNMTAENNYGLALLREGQLDEAIPHLTKAIQLCESCPNPRKILGEVFLKQGKYDKAIAYFNEFLKQNEDAEVYYLLADALGTQKKYDEAIKYLAKALELAPKYYDARNKMVVALLATNRFDEALSYFNELLQQNKASAETHYNLAVALSRKNKYDEAIKHLARTLEIDPNYPNARGKMEITLIISGRTDEAIAYFNEILRTSKDPAEAYENLGVVYTQAGKQELAIQSFTRAVELKPDSTTALNNLAWALAATGDVSIQDANKAIELAQRACDLTEYKKPEFLDTLAVAYASAGRFEDAVKTANQAINIAKAGNQEDLANEIQSHMKLYQDGHPYREK